MEAVAPSYFLKFWRPSNQIKDHRLSNGNSDTTEITTSMVDTDDDEFIVEEEEDSFFELELTTVPDFDKNKCESKSNNRLDNESNIFDSKEQAFHNSTYKAGNTQQKFSSPTVSLSPTDLLSKRKILPIEPTSKPQSPISLLKSAPRFRVLMFKKSKSMTVQGSGKTEMKSVFVDTPKNKKQERKLFTVKFKLKEAANIPIFTRDNSLRKQISDDSDDSSKRFSIEAIQKYLKLIKPLYIKVSKRQSEKPKFSGELSPSSSPATLSSSAPKEKQGSIPAGIRVVCKHLGKSKSASAAAVVPPPIATRRDDSLRLQDDGIQSAILHCKRSFNSSSRDSSLLSRFASDPLHEKSSNQEN